MVICGLGSEWTGLCVQVFDFLKAVILKSFKDEERRVASRWMQGLPEDQLCIFHISGVW